MKKIILSFVLGWFSMLSFGQTKVAVYAPEENISGFDKETKEFVVGEFVRAINQSSRYTAVNRSKEFEKVISSERIYQHSGLVDEKEISKLGKGSGASLVCVVVFRKVHGDRNIEARLIDVEREEVVVSDNRVIKNLDATSLKFDATAMAKTIIEGGNNRQTVYIRSYNEQLIFDKNSGSKISGYRNGSWQTLSRDEVMKRLSTCPEAYQLYNSGIDIRSSWRNWEGWIGLAGLVSAGICNIGWMLDEEDGNMYRSDSQWKTPMIISAAIPIAFIIVTEFISVPIGNAKIKKAAKTYNESPYIGENLEFKMGFSPCGIGLTMNF